MRLHLSTIGLLAFLVAPAAVQTPTTVTLDQALRYAAEHYPAVRAALEQVNASAAGVRVARAAFLPRLDSLWQSNRATTNNVFGQLLPQSVIPSISGPVLPASAGSVWGSAAGALFSWEAYDFGLRDAVVAGADATLAKARADEALTGLQVQSAVGDAFLGLLAAERVVLAAQADVERRDVLARSVRVLVDNDLRPGADGSRAEAERAAALTRLIKARETDALARTLLARLLGLTDGTVQIAAADLLERTPAGESAAGSAAEHPLARVSQAAIDEARAQQDVLARTDRPRLFVQSSVFARGSGAFPDGRLDGGIGGLGFDRANWSAGLTLVFPNVFDASSLHARKDVAAALVRVQAARRDESVLAISSQRRAAAAMIEAARAISANTPVQLAAARANEAQAHARYQAGLATLLEAAEAQSLLVQSDVQDQLARIDVWRARLAEAVAQGSLAPFLNHP